MKFFKLLAEQLRKIWGSITIDKIWSAAQYVMSVVLYDVGYDIRMIKTRKNIVTVRLLAAIDRKSVV